MPFPKSVRAVLFDAVGTLMYPDPTAPQVYAAAGRRFGSGISKSEIAFRFRSALSSQFDRRIDSPAATSQQAERQRWREIVEQIFDDVPDAGGPLFESLWDHFSCWKNWSVYDDVGPALRGLQDQGQLCAIASNFDDRLVNICAAIDVFSQCRYVFCSAQLGFSKPHAEFYRAIERQLMLPPAAILMVGDDPDCDLAGPRAVGWHAILINRAGPVHDRHTIERLTELL